MSTITVNLAMEISEELYFGELETVCNTPYSWFTPRDQIQDNKTNKFHIRMGYASPNLSEDAIHYIEVIDKAKWDAAWILTAHYMPHIVRQILAENYDADTADVIMQHAIFGKVIYG